MRTDVVASRRHENKASTLVLESLQAILIPLSNVIKQNVAVVKTQQQHGSNNIGTHFLINIPADPVQVADLPIDGLTKFGDVLVHIYLQVENNTY